MSKGFIWVVDDDSSIRWVLEKTLTSTNMMCESFGDAESVIQALERNVPDVIISDIRMREWMLITSSSYPRKLPRITCDYHDGTLRFRCSCQCLSKRSI